MREQIAFPYQPIVKRRSLTTAQEAGLRQHPTSPHRAGLHPEDHPYVADDLDAYSQVPARITPRSAIRYQPSSQQQARQRPRVHWMVWAGVVMFIMIFGWAGISAIGNWWTTTLDDWHYGRPRTFQTDQNVGHYGYTSHFVALNLNGKIEVIETQPQNPNQQESTRMYIVATLTTDQDLAPVTLRFEDLNGDGKLDMLVFVGNSLEVPLYNNGVSFQTQPPGR